MKVQELKAMIERYDAVDSLLGRLNRPDRYEIAIVARFQQSGSTVQEWSIPDDIAAEMKGRLEEERDRLQSGLEGAVTDEQ